MSPPPTANGPASSARTRIVIAGGGFGGAYTARHLERLCRRRPDADVRRRLLTFVVIGGGLVGTELVGELTAFVDAIVRYYPRVDRAETRFFLLEAGDRILPEIVPPLAEYAARVLRSRGVEVRAG